MNYAIVGVNRLAGTSMAGMMDQENLGGDSRWQCELQSSCEVASWHVII